MDHTHEWCEGERDRKGEGGVDHVDKRSMLMWQAIFPQDGGTLEPGRRRVGVGFIIPAFVYWMLDVLHAWGVVEPREDD
jgi:hypothetical protein